MAGTCKESNLFVYLFFIFATCESLNLRFIMFVQNETIIYYYYFYICPIMYKPNVC